MTVHCTQLHEKKILCHFLSSLQMQQQDGLDRKCRVWVYDNQA